MITPLYAVNLLTLFIMGMFYGLFGLEGVLLGIVVMCFWMVMQIIITIREDKYNEQERIYRRGYI